jgi:hypothetical protein
MNNHNTINIQYETGVNSLKKGIGVPYENMGPAGKDLRPDKLRN